MAAIAAGKRFFGIEHNPAHFETAVERIRAVVAAGSDVRARAGRTLSQTRLGWLPPEYRDDYFHLRRNFKYRAREARRIIEDQIARDLDRYAATGVLPQASRLGVNP